MRRSPRHNSRKLRTCVDRNEHLGEVSEDSYVVKSVTNKDVDETMKIIRESKLILQIGHPQLNSFHIAQSGTAGYIASVRFNGCQYKSVRIQYQVTNIIDGRKKRGHDARRPRRSFRASRSWINITVYPKKDDGMVNIFMTPTSTVTERHRLVLHV